MSEFDKEFSPEFKRDIAELLEKCMENETDSLSITMNCGEFDLDIDMTFRVYRHKEVEHE